MSPRRAGLKLPSPPSHLREDGRRLWKVVVANYDLPADSLVLLGLACSALDRAEDARRHIDQHGPSYTTGSGTMKLRPEVVVERDSRAAVSRLVRQLNLDIEPLHNAPGRPPGPGRAKGV